MRIQVTTADPAAQSGQPGSAHICPPPGTVLSPSLLSDTMYSLCLRCIPVDSRESLPILPVETELSVRKPLLQLNVYSPPCKTCQATNPSVHIQSPSTLYSLLRTKHLLICPTAEPGENTSVHVHSPDSQSWLQTWGSSCAQASGGWFCEPAWVHLRA